MRHVDGTPMGTRGGTSVIHVFPADGDYVIKVSMHNEPLGGIYGRYSMLTMDIKEQVDVSINGERVALLDVSPSMSETDFGQNGGANGLEMKTPAIHIKAGPQRVSVAFVQRLDGPVDDLIAPLENTLADVNISYGVTALPHMRDMSVIGPSVVTGVSETPSRKRIFICRPLNQAQEETCAAQIVKNLTAQAYRGQAGRRRHPGRARVLRARTEVRRLRERRPPRAAVDPRQPALPVPARAGARQPAEERVGRLSHQRSGTGVAAVVLPVGRRVRMPSS